MKIYASAFLALLLILFLLNGCDKETGVTLPAVTTTAVTGITGISAISGGTVTNDGGDPVAARGVCWGTSENPTLSNSKTTDGSGSGNFVSNLTNLETQMTYYARAYATNKLGTGYGNQVTFTTERIPVTDVDGNVYHTVSIGTQVWLVENLKTTKYRNGDPIPNVTNLSTWNFLKTPAYCNYDNNSDYVSSYGRLYNWYAVNDSRNICPAGWHVPTMDEWMVLAEYLGGTHYCGGKLKEQGTVHWNAPNTGATNETGFTGLPGGQRNGGGYFNSLLTIGHYWTSTPNPDPMGSYYAAAFSLHYNQAALQWTPSIDKDSGFAVRCVKD